MLKLKLQCSGHLMRRANSLEKTLDAGKDLRQEEKGMTEDQMVEWHHQLKLMSIMLVMPFNHLILCGLLSFNLSQNQGLLH